MLADCSRRRCRLCLFWKKIDIRNKWFHAKDSMGLTWARSQAQQLYDGEEFVLQIDSHMRFAKGWDTKIISMLEKCPSNKPVMSHLPAVYTPPYDLDSSNGTNIRTIKEINEGTKTTLSATVIYEPLPARPLRTAFIAGAYVFGPGQSILEVPADPFLYFGQEEMNIAVRLWTHGWDIFAPNEMVLYHLYKNDFNTSKLKVKMHWENQSWPALNAKAEKRMSHIFEIEKSTDPVVTYEIRILGLEKNVLWKSMKHLQEFSSKKRKC